MKSILHPTNRHNNRGSTSTVVLIIIAIVVVLAIFLSISKPWGQKAKTAWAGATEWTSENIIKDPVGYFSWAIGELKNQQQKLKANRFAITVEKEKSLRAAAQHADTASALKAAIDSARTAYKALPDAAPTDDGRVVKKFPLTWQGIEFKTLAEFQRQVLQAENKRRNADDLAGRLTASARKLEIYLVQLADKENETAMKLDTATAQFEMLKAQKTIEGIGEIGNSINDLIVKTDVLVAQTEPDKLTITDIAASNAATQRSGQGTVDFEALMR